MQIQDKIFLSLHQIWAEIKQNGLPSELIQQAVADNSWFTPYYIEKSIENMSNWYEEENWRSFLEKYHFSDKKKEIGMIGAGNVPLVAWHDILMILLSGNVAKVKLSHQDKTLIPYIVDKWRSILPEIKERIVFVNKIEAVSALIATGSNSTATQIEAMYPDLPLLIRKNRFSIALCEELTDNEAEKLCEDILLYNGLGCRNVSNLWLSDKKGIDCLVKVLKKYPKALLSDNYLQKIQYEKARLSLLNIPFVDAENALLTFSENPQPTSPSVINVIIEKTILANSLSENADLQCIVGKEIVFGQSQKPQIGDFADGIDTLRWLGEQ